MFAWNATEVNLRSKILTFKIVRRRTLVQLNFCCHTKIRHIVSITWSASPNTVTRVSKITSLCRRGKTSNTNAKRISENETQRRPWNDSEVILKRSAEVSSSASFTVHPFHFYQFYTHTTWKCSYGERLRGRRPSFHVCRSIASTPRPGLRNAMRPVKGVPGLAGR